MSRYFIKISGRSSAALVKTVVANFMKSQDIPLPIDEHNCVSSSFDHLVFLAVPIMAVLKMFSSGIVSSGVSTVLDQLPDLIDSNNKDEVPHLGTK